MFKTRATKKEEIKESWYIIDATGQRIGKIASIAAELLMAKNDPKTRAYLKPLHKVVITNAGQVDATARKRAGKTYTRYSGFPGGLKVHTLDEVLNTHPERVLEHAIRGMLPRTKMGDAIHATNLYIYAGSEHKHGANNPEIVNINEIKL